MYKKWINLLIDINLFRGIDIDELNNILGCLMPSVYSYRKKENIVNSGDRFNGIGIVLSGEVLITKDNVFGERVIMSKLKEKDVFGEIVAFSGNGKWPATVIASTDCEVMFLPPDNIIGTCPRACSGHKLMIQNMLMIVSKKALNLNKKIEYLTMKTIRNKVSFYIFEQHLKNKQFSFMMPLSRNELAEFLNVTRPSLSRELVKMKEEGIIDFYKSSFKIIDIEKLKSYV